MSGAAPHNSGPAWPEAFEPGWRFDPDPCVAPIQPKYNRLGFDLTEMQPERRSRMA